MFLFHRILTKVGFLDKTLQRRKSEKTQNERELFCNKFEGTILGKYYFFILVNF